jgi:tetratricopeptide (TPR) repeat protein
VTMPELDGDDDWPDRDEMLVKTGDSLADKGDAAGARACYQLAIDSGHPYWASYAAHHLGVMLTGQDDPAGARACYQLAIDSGHADVAPFAAANLGILLAGQGDVGGARAAYQLAIDSGHPDVPPHAAANLASLTSRAADSKATYTAGGGPGESGSMVPGVPPA